MMQKKTLPEQVGCGLSISILPSVV